MLNVHPSLLPRWRGAAPIERAIMAGDAQTGVTIMRPTAELDAGPMFLQEPERIGPDDDYSTLAARLERLGGDLLVDALNRQPPFVEQPDEGVTIADKIGPEDRVLDPSRPAAELERQVRAYAPWPGSWLETPVGRVVVLEASVDPAPGAAGRLVAGDDLRLGTSDGWLVLDRVQPAGKRPMDGASFIRGRPELKGDIDLHLDLRRD
jgi:methionyl-tRNA formyltransferase